MSLGACKECGKEVSSSAKTCPSCGVKKPYKSKGKNLTSFDGVIIVTLFVVAVILTNHSSKYDKDSKNLTPSTEASLASKYESSWHTDVHLKISQALVKSKIRNCGEYKYKQSRTHQGEYVVYCTRDGTNWISYLVWTGTKKVMGPYDIDPSLGS